MTDNYDLIEDKVWNKFRKLMNELGVPEPTGEWEWEEKYKYAKEKAWNQICELVDEVGVSLAADAFMHITAKSLACSNDERYISQSFENGLQTSLEYAKLFEISEKQEQIKTNT